jgi:hypothetical protein
MRQRDIDKLVAQIGNPLNLGPKKRKKAVRLLSREERVHRALTEPSKVDEKSLTPAEGAFLLRALKQGSKVLRNGWPDFLVERDGEVFAVEVKQGPDDLSDAQVRMFAALERVGLKVYVWAPKHSKKAVPWRRFLPNRYRNLAAELKAG